MYEVENLFLEVTKAIDEHNISSAKEILDEILWIDPGYGRAHNHLGWIYETKIKDFEKAKMHYELAIKFCKGSYPIVYVNFGYLLIEYGYFQEAEKIIEEGLKVNGIDKSSLIYQKGKIAEHNLNFILAYRLYKNSLALNFNREFQKQLLNEISRLKIKMSRWQKLQSKIFGSV